MKKITFQRKQRVVKRVFLLLIIAFVSDLSAQTLLTVGADGALTINSEGTLNVSGLELKPSTEYTINETQVSKALTAEVLNGNDGTESMEKVYSSTIDLEDFVGTITYMKIRHI